MEENFYSDGVCRVSARPVARILEHEGWAVPRFGFTTEANVGEHPTANLGSTREATDTSRRHAATSWTCASSPLRIRRSNYVDPLLDDWQKAYYGPYYDRLLNVKKQWDTTGFFDFQQGVGSDFEPDLEKPIDLSPLNRTF